MSSEPNMTEPPQTTRPDVSRRPQQRLKGALMLTLAVLVGALQDAFIKDLSGKYPVYEMQLLRGGTAMLLIFAWIAATGGLRHLLGPRPGFLLFRSVVLAVASLTFYMALAAMQFADAVAIYFSMPLMIAALSGLVIGESVPLRRWLAVIVAFAGVAIVVRPGTGLFNPASLIVLFSTLCYAIGLMLTRPLGMQVDSKVMALWQVGGFVVTAALLFLVFGNGAFHDPAHPSLSYLTAGWVDPPAGDLVRMLGFGVAAAAASFLYTLGYKLAAPSFVAPFEYSALLWAALWGFVFWGDIPHASTFAGAALIIGAGLWMVWRERRIG
jgi:drug/metabolite transporter (DMT)-like permease